EGYFVINVAEEIINDAHACIPIDPYVEDVERQRETVDLVSDTIQRELGHTGRKVVVHCHMGMERSVLAVAWWLHSYKNMSLDEAYELIRQKRPVALDRREWIGEPNPDDEVFTYA
ncbi:MAG: dual specificity protein phosphatase family protein, partial [Gemmatimonadetes bacterium]|nr:dual specificity protein phosphatase family protein [Gemmatimonadota bacterium]